MWLATLLLVPGLLALLLVMEWLERRFTLNLIVGDLARLLSSDVDPAVLEVEVARQTAPLFGPAFTAGKDRRHPSN